MNTKDLPRVHSPDNTEIDHPTILVDADHVEMLRNLPCLCGRSHDITFCCGLRCGRTSTCFRFEFNHHFRQHEIHSVANFSDSEGACMDYVPFDTGGTNEGFKHAND